MTQEFIFLNWQFSERLYSTEIVPLENVETCIKLLKEIIGNLRVTSIVPITDIFWNDRDNLELPMLLEYLEGSLKNNLVESDQELVSYQKLLGPELRHGPEILKSITEILQSIYDGHGEYDPVTVLDEFLKGRRKILTALEEDAIRRAAECLGNHKKRFRIGDYNREILVRDILGALEIDTTDVPGETLEMPVLVLQDDGMGYGAINGHCTETEIYNKELRIWM